ncbi:Hypothetical predicted protein, partial [Marmota monax]
MWQRHSPREDKAVWLQGESWVPGQKACRTACPAGPPALCLLIPHSPSGGRDAGRPQEPAPCILVPGPWGSPESEHRGLGPRPSPSTSPESSPPSQRHSPGTFPKWSRDAPHPSLLESDGAEPSSLKKEVTGKAPHPGQEAQSEGPARTPEAAGAEPGEDSIAAEG